MLADICQVHVDSYQSRLYASLSDADDKVELSGHCVLNGFYVGNHHQPGCLTTSSSTRIHSCEPGTRCHTELLKSDRVVWITPIVTRSKEGLVVPELGAGGGGGDLHQVPELELSNIGSMGELQERCKQLAEQPNNLTKFLSKIESAISSGDMRMSLAGLQLEVEQDITLKEFLERLQALDQANSALADNYTLNEASRKEGVAGDTIYYPFSRHSSYTELCGLVEAFKPADIYPCTVDEENWTQDLSMRALFGHLCSGMAFSHDEKMQLLLTHRLEDEGHRRKRQKMDLDDTQSSRSTQGTSQDYPEVARLEPQFEEGDANEEFPQSQDVHVVNDEEEAEEDQSQPLPPHIAAIKAAFEFHMARASAEGSASSLSDESQGESVPGSPSALENASESQITITQSALESQSQMAYGNAGLQLDGPQDENPLRSVRAHNLPTSAWCHGSIRRNDRVAAYQAAKRTLQTCDSGDWDDLGIRSLGYKGHCEAEEEL